MAESAAEPDLPHLGQMLGLLRFTSSVVLISLFVMSAPSVLTSRRQDAQAGFVCPGRAVVIRREPGGEKYTAFCVLTVIFLISFSRGTVGPGIWTVRSSWFSFLLCSSCSIGLLVAGFLRCPDMRPLQPLMSINLLVSSLHNPFLQPWKNIFGRHHEWLQFK